MDHNDDKVQKLHQGVSPIYEPGIEELVKECIQAEKIDFTTDLGKAVDHADALFFALPTPPGEDGSADLSYVL